MYEQFNFPKNLSREEKINEILLSASTTCKDILYGELLELQISDYVYCPDEAIEELGLDKELVHQLTEDYVIQILKSISQFHQYLEKLKKEDEENRNLDYVALRELAHKNLGVARNLRIKDAEKLLYILMKKDDLQYISVSIKALKACAIKLNPICAYDTLNLIKIKSNF